MERSQIVFDFGSYTKPQLEKTKNELSISLPLQKLLSVAAYYKTATHCDPTVEELKILDTFVSSAANIPEKQYISELFTKHCLGTVIKRYRAYIFARHVNKA